MSKREKLERKRNKLIVKRMKILKKINKLDRKLHKDKADKVELSRQSGSILAPDNQFPSFPFLVTVRRRDDDILEAVEIE